MVAVFAKTSTYIYLLWDANETAPLLNLLPRIANHPPLLYIGHPKVPVVI